MDREPLERAVLDEITPTPDEERAVREAAEALQDEVREAIREVGAQAEPLLVGSVAKGTFLRAPDLDVFVLFPPSTPRETLEEQGLAIGMKVLSGRKQYAEHPYTKGRYRGLDAEIVPCFRIDDPSEKMSAVDRTPFHTRFVTERLRPGRAADVRLFKKFLKGIGAYGAEEAVRGFSGYLAELLVLRFESFRGTVEAGSRWTEAVRLWIDGRGSELRGRGEPMVFVDPVDPSRNVASALSTEKYALFIHACRSYLASPSRKFFFPEPPRPLPAARLRSELGSRGTELLGLRLRTPEVIPDIYHSQLRKFQRGVSALCEEHGFHVLQSAFHEIGGETLFLFEFEVFRLPPVRGHRGPPAGNPREKEFHEKWARSPHRRGALHVVDGVWAVDVEREHTEPSSLLKAQLPSLSLGKHLNEEVKRGYRLMKGPDLFRKDQLLPLTLLLDRRWPWER